MSDWSRLDTVIETERLILRVTRSEDFEPWAEMMTDYEATRFLGGTQDRATAWRSVSAMAGSWLLNGFGMFSFIEKTSGRWIGRGGPWFPNGWPGREIGWSIAPAAQRQGYALEGASACMNYAFDVLGWDEAIHCIDPANTRSIRLAEKLGSARKGTATLPVPGPVEVDIYGQTRDQWRARGNGQSVIAALE